MSYKFGKTVQLCQSPTQLVSFWNTEESKHHFTFRVRIQVAV